jgi:hypothetical protein
MFSKANGKVLGVTLAVLAVFCVEGCKKADGGGTPNGGDPGAHGRYNGVGIYTPGQLWTKTVQATAPGDVAAAKTGDDQAIIVVVDSQTGELRACGDLSGYCVGMNPWKQALAKTQQAPVWLTEHESDIVAAETPPSHALRRHPGRSASTPHSSLATVPAKS